MAVPIFITAMNHQGFERVQLGKTFEITLFSLTLTRLHSKYCLTHLKFPRTLAPEDAENFVRAGANTRARVCVCA